MAGGYLIDPATGRPAVRAAGGALLPLPISRDDLTAAGLPGPQPLVMPTEPRRGMDPNATASNEYTDQINGLLHPPPAPPSVLDAPGGFRVINDAPTVNGKARPDFESGVKQLQAEAPAPYQEQPSAQQGAPTGVDPTHLVRSGSRVQAPGGQGGVSAEERLIQLAGDQAVSRGAGGPARLGIAGETRKFHQMGAVPEAVSTDAAESRRASNDYDRALANQITEKRDEAYQAYMTEQAARAGAVDAQRERQQHQQQQLREYEQKRDKLEAEAASMKAPQVEDYWGSRSTASKLATAISITLGGALQGLRGGTNTGLDAANRAVDQWVTEQREDYQRARGKVSDADNKYARMVKTFGDENLAEQNLRIQAHDIRDNMLKTYAEKIGTPSAMEAYQQTMLQSQAARAEAQKKAYQDAGADIEQKFSMQGGGGAGGGGTILKRLRAEAEAKKLFDERNGNANKDSKGAELLGAYNGLDALKKPAGPDKPWTPEGQNIAGKVARHVVDAVGGDSTYKNLALDADERMASDSFSTRRQALISIGTQLSGAGAPSEGEAVRSAAANAQTEEQLNNVIETYRPVVAAKLKAYGKNVPSTDPSVTRSFKPVR